MLFGGGVYFDGLRPEVFAPFVNWYTLKSFGHRGQKQSAFSTILCQKRVSIIFQWLLIIPSGVIFGGGGYGYLSPTTVFGPGQLCESRYSLT